ncbi:MAG: class F sortase [Nocardioidaceae bacterium]
MSVGPRTTVLLVAALLGTLLVAGAALAATRLGASPAAPHAGGERTVAAGRTPTPLVLAARPARRAGSVPVPERPDSARLPSGRVVPVRAVSTRPDAMLDVPGDIEVAGWWRGGSRLGDPFGSTLIAAHVDSTTQGLGPYAELLSVRPGQRVTVTSRHLEQDFVIRSRQLVRQGSLAHDRWIYAPTGRRRLTLVTCAPPYVRSRGGYQNLAVVTAVPLSDPAPRSPR